MTDYTKTTDFAAKDSLPSGDSGKIIKGLEFETEFDNIATAIATKSNIASPTFTGTTTIPTVDINGGAIDAVTLGTNSAVTEAQVDNININGNTISSSDTNGNVNISPNGTGTVVINTDLDVDNININGNAIISTDLNGNIDLTPNGTGEVNISKVDIDAGAIDGTVIGAASAAAITATTGQFNTSLNVDGTVTADNLTVESAGTIQLTQNTTAQGDLLGRIEFHDEDAVTGDGGVVRLEAIRGGDVDAPDFQIISTTNGGVLTPRLFLDSATGNIGIGTASPSSVLHLSTSNDPKITLTDTGFGASADITGSNGNLRLNSQTATIFDMAGSEVVRISSAGNVGIGTTSPTTILDCRENSTGGSTQIRVYNTDNSNTTTQTAALFLAPDSRGNGALIYAEKENADFSTSAGRDVALVFSPVLNNSQTERMRIDSAGNVGINTTSPNIYSTSGVTSGVLGIQGGTGALLALNANGTAFSGIDMGGAGIRRGGIYALNGSDLALYTNTTNSGTGLTEALRITSAGDIGINTTTPDNKFHVVAGAEGEVAQFTGSIEARGLSIRSETNTNASAHVVFNSQSGGSKGMFTFETDTVERVRIDENGYVIIPAGVTLGTAAGTYNAANTLDDYEEGSWTPVFKGSTTAGTYTYTTQAGRYVKVGNLVTVWCTLTDITASSAGTGDIVVGGLPFTIANLSTYERAPNGGTRIRQVATGFTAQPNAFGGQNSTDVYFLIPNGTSDIGVSITTYYASNMDIGFTLTYEAA